MTEPSGLEFTGLRELNAYLKRIGVPDDEIKVAMGEAGALVQREAWRIMPVQSGASARTLKVSKNKNVLRIQVGSKTVQAPYAMHATALGVVRGGMTMRVPAHSRRGTKGVSGYVRQARVRDFPYLFTAFDRTRQRVIEAYVNGIGALIEKAAPR